jgi:hypothetical protein
MKDIMNKEVDDRKEDAIITEKQLLPVHLL